MNALGRYLLISLLFVFGTMVEFAAVLVYKQKMERDEKSLRTLGVDEDVESDDDDETTSLTTNGRNSSGEKM